MFWLLLSRAYPESRISVFPCSASEEVPRAGREHDQDTWPELAKGRFHATCPGYRLGGAGQGALVTAWGQAGHWPAGGEQMCSASLTSLGFYSSLLFIVIIVRFSFWGFFPDSPALRDGARGLSQQQCGSQLPAGVKPWHCLSWFLSGALRSRSLPAVSDWRPELLVQSKVWFVCAGFGSGLSRARSRLQEWRTQTLAPTEGWATAIVQTCRCLVCAASKIQILNSKGKPLVILNEQVYIWIPDGFLWSSSLAVNSGISYNLWCQWYVA